MTQLVIFDHFRGSADVGSSPITTAKADMRTRAASELGGRLRQCGWVVFMYSIVIDYVANEENLTPRSSEAISRKIGKIGKISDFLRPFSGLIGRSFFLANLFSMLRKTVNPALEAHDLAVILHLEQQTVDRVPTAKLGPHHDFRDRQSIGSVFEQR